MLASTVFHSGTHPVKRLTTTGGFSLTGTGNHPVLCLVSVLGVPTLLWKLLDEIQPGDRVVLQRTPREEIDVPWAGDADAALLAGAFVSEGFVSENRAGFNNLRPRVLRRRRRRVRPATSAVGGTSPSRVHRLRQRRCIELDIHDLCGPPRHRPRRDGRASAAPPSRCRPSSGSRRIGTRRVFLQALFEGDGSSSLLPRNTMQISYSTRSDRLAREVQQLLLEFGVVSSLCRYANGEIKVVISNRRDARLFAQNVGFLRPQAGEARG